MKAFFILLILAPIVCLAQLEANNFKVTPEGRVIWQKVYEASEFSFEDLVTTVRSNKRFYDIQVEENKITFQGRDIETDPRSVGFSRGGTSFYALGTIQAYFTIDYKPGRYRITAENITSAVPVLQLAPSQYYENGSKYQQTPIEESVGSGKGLKKGFVKKESLIMGHAIEKEFKVSRKSNLDENW